jgi:hypothetical protein
MIDHYRKDDIKLSTLEMVAFRQSTVLGYGPAPSGTKNLFCPVPGPKTVSLRDEPVLIAFLSVDYILTLIVSLSLLFSLNQLKTHSQTPPVTQTRNIELNINNKQLITVNTAVLSLHSDYFKTLFNGPFFERNQTVIPIHLPETISIESFIHLINIIMNRNDLIKSDRLPDLLRLCDEYLLDYLPFHLAHYILEEFLNGTAIDIVQIESKPNLISSLVRAIFSHLLTNNTNISLEIFSKLTAIYLNELRTLILSFLQHKCWFHDEYSPFLL